MKNKKMKTVSNPAVVTPKSTENPNLACNICGVDVKTIINFHNHLIKDHSKLDLSFCILEMLNLIRPNNEVKTNPLTRKSNSTPFIRKNRPNLNKDVTAAKLPHPDEILNLRNVCSDVNLNLSNTQNASSLSNQSSLQPENVSQHGGEAARNSLDSCQKALERTPKCFETSETSCRNLNEPYTDEQILFFNQLGLSRSPNQVSINTNASVDVESSKKLLYNQLESFNFRIPMKFFAKNPVSEENCASELSRSQSLRVTPESELTETSNSNLVLTAEYDLSTQQSKSIASSLGSCLKSKRPTTQHIRLNCSSEVLPLVSQENPVNQPNGIVPGRSAAAIGTSSESNKVSKSETITHSIKSSDCSKNNQFSVNSSLNVDSSLVLSSLSQQNVSAGLHESCLSPIQNRLSENPQGTNNKRNLGKAVQKKRFSTCNSAYDKFPVNGSATVVRTDSKIKSQGKKLTQNALTAVKNKGGAVKKTKVKAAKVASVSTDLEKVDFKQNASALVCKSNSKIALIFGRDGNQTADKSTGANTNLEIVSSFVRSVVNNDATDLNKKIMLSNFSVKENLNLSDTVVCENSRSLIQNVTLIQENVPESVEVSKVPQSGKLQISADNKVVQRGTNGLRKVSQRDEVLRNNEISQASGSSDSFGSNAQTYAVADFYSKPDILQEKNYSREVFESNTIVEPCSIKAEKTMTVPFLQGSNGVIWNVCDIQNGFQPSKVSKPVQLFNFGVMPHISPVNVNTPSDMSKTSKVKQAKKTKAQVTGKGSVKLGALSVESEQNFSATKKRKKKSKADELKSIKIDDSIHETLNGTKSVVQKVPNLVLPLSDSFTEVSQASSSSSSVILNRNYCDGSNDMECSRETSDNSNLSNVSSGAASDINPWNGSNGLSFETGSQIKSGCLHPMTICQQKMTVDDISEFVSPGKGEKMKRRLPPCPFKFQKENNDIPHYGNTCEKGTQSLESSIWSPFPSNGENAKVYEKRRRPYCCDVCGKNYSRKNHLIRHCRMHLNERPYECDICHKSFTTSSILKQHQRLHSGERPFVCPVCEKTFTQKSSLLTHSMLHSGKPFKCYFCRFAVVSNHKLQRHLKRHYISDSGLYCCVCEYRFGLEGSFREHLTEVHGYSSVNNIELVPNSKLRRRVRKNYGGPIE